MKRSRKICRAKPSRETVCRAVGIDDKPREPYAAIVRHYTATYQKRAKEELRHFVEATSLCEALEAAAFAKLADGRRHPHQYRLKQTALREAHRRLRLVDLLVRRTIGEIKGIGELMVYDTAHRIGAHLDLEPELVYLHAGTRRGAAALGLGLGEVSLKTNRLPPAFRKLMPAEIEDCLCIYKDELQRMRDATVR